MKKAKRKPALKRKPKNRRAAEKFPALKPEYNLRSRHDLIDYDYVDKLGEKDKAWLNKFTEEYINTTLDRKNPKNNLHNTKDLIKDCDNRSNARRRCVLTKAKAAGKTVYIEDLENHELREITENFDNTSSDGENNT